MRPHSRQRPVAVTLLAGVLLLKAVIAGALAVGWRLDEGQFTNTLGLPSLLADAGDTMAVTALFVVAAVLLVIAAAGLYAGRRIGWLLAMVLTGVFIAADIITFGAGTAHHVWMVLNIVTAFYLNQRDVREQFLPPAADPQPAGAPA
jgi:uncharacterized membrane protein (DUF2068 family)